MNPRLLFRLLRVAALLAISAGSSMARSGAVPAAVPGSPRVLARVPVGDGLADSSLPVYAILTGPDGVAYALTFVPAERVALARDARVLATAGSPEEFVIALGRRRGARAKAREIADVVMDDGRHVVARADEAQAEALAVAGFDLTRLPPVPMDTSSRETRVPLAEAAWDGAVAGMVEQVTEAGVTELAGGLSGGRPVSVGGSLVTIASRHTNSGQQIGRATQFAYERLESFGLAPSYHAWQRGSVAGRNVVADLPGVSRPSEIVILCAHLDDMPYGSVAPGADDNASGSTGVLLAARILSDHRFQRTIRFVLFTGEEQGLYGSSAYAASLAAQDANVVAVLNLDMISWDGGGAPTLRLHTRTPGSSGYAADRAIADTFRAAVSLYVGNALAPVDDPDWNAASDHYSFWSRGWPALLAIEDDVNDFTPHYHTTADTLATLNIPYFANFVKASVATTAHLGVLATQGTAFYPLTPCRVLDTRESSRPATLGPPALAAGQTRAFTVGTVCGIPSDAAALAVNVTVTEPLAAGFVTLFPGRGVAPGTSNVHFRQGGTRACSSVVSVGPGATFSAFNGSAGTAHLIVDVAGVFR
ncbi:MAG: Zn-dependent exopeptidase M28 [Holophagales bacterium]|nr:Zn-dependent exopeptidase M28 [Holophagales bacterium]